MNRRSTVRPLLASAAIAAAIALAGCDTDGGVPMLRSMQPLSPAMIADIERRNMAKESPILVRIFKKESELEIWKEDKSVRMALLRTYPICRWSGELGPKIKEGDRQAPEGFYAITPGLLNPNSQYYLAINMGFPNAYDKANNRTGAFLMIHGDCSSRGCYAMTDEQISEIYALARESFFGGQASFQIQAFPFRMTPQNMARHRNSPHMSFWKMLKTGYDHFEVTRQEPKVDVCERRYVFNAESKGRFSSTAKCPAMQVPEEVMAAVRQKEQRDNAQVADLIRRGTPASAVRTYADGGMHPTFMAAVQPYNIDEDGVVRTKITSRAGTIPANIKLPGERAAPRSTGSTGSTRNASEPVVAVEAAPSSARVASAQPSSSGGGMFGNLFSGGGESSGGVTDRVSRWWSGSPAPAEAPKAKAAPSKTAVPRPKPAEAKSPAKQTANNGAIRPQPKQEPGQDANQRQANAPAPQSGGGNGAILSGAQPTVPAGGFDGRFGAWR